MKSKIHEESATYDESEAGNTIGSQLPIVDKRIGSFTNRLSSIIGVESLRAFALRAGINEGSLRNMLRGGLPRLDTLVAIAEAAEVDVNWLALGIEPMRETGESARYSTEAGDPTHYDESDYATAPLYDIEASCGHGAWNDNERITSKLAFRRDWLRSEGLEASQLAAIRARGDSMAPTIQSGDTLLVDLRITTPRSDGIYIIEQEGGIAAKRIQRAPDGSLYIRSDNKAYQDFHIPHARDLKVVGRLAWFGRRVD